MNRTPEFPPMYLEYLKIARQAGALSPVWLGGAGGAGGGSGGPPGGWIGQLPQGQVTYDTTEASTTSGSSSLVDNLNHIRYQLANAQFNSGVAGVEFAQSEYTTADIVFSSSTDGSFVDVDAVNAIIGITPNSAGTFQVTFSFNYLSAFTVDGNNLEIAFRLTDGTTNLDPIYILSGSQTVSHPINLSGLFTWANNSPRTIKLQKKLIATSAVPFYNQISISTTGSLHMDVFRLGSIATGFVSGTGATGRVTYWTAGSTLGSDSTFTWDAVNSRLGVGKLSLTSGSMSLAGSVFALDASMKIDPTGATNGMVLGYNGSKWVPVVSSGSAAGTTGSGGTGQFAFWSATNALTGYSHIDYTSATSKVRLGASGDSVLVGVNATPGNNTTFQITQPDTAGGTDPSVLILTPGILTAQTGNPANFLSQSATITWVKANLPTSFYPNIFSAPLLNSTLVNGVITAAATVKINGAPTSGSNLSILNTYALEITSGSTYIGGPLSLAGKFFKLDATMEIDPSGATNGQVLTYSAGLGKWIAQVSSASGGGGASGISGAGASSRIAYFTSGSVISGDANFSWDTTNQKMIIGGTPADVPVGSSASLVVIKESGLAGISLFEYGSSLASVFMSRANGTKASPSNLLAGDIVGGFNISGFGSTAWASSSRLKIQGIAAEDWTDAVQGMYLSITVTQPGSTTAVDAFDVKYDRVVVTGKDLILDASIELDPTAAVSNQVLTYNGSKWIPQTFSGVSGISGSGAAGDVAFWTSGSVIGGNATLFWDTSSTPNKLIIGSNVAAVGGPQLTLVSQATGSGLSIEGYSVTPTLSSFKAGGTQSSPTGVLLDQVMLSLTARGYRSGAFNNTSTSRINFIATEDWTSGSTGSDILVYTTGSGNTTLVNSFRFRPDSIDIVGKNFKLDAAMEIDPSGATSGSVLGYNGSKWVPMSLSSGSSGGSSSSSGISGSGANTQVAYFTSGSVLAGSSNLIWNDTNNQFKIGVTSGSASMSINSSSVEKNITLRVQQPPWIGGSQNRALQITAGSLTAQTEELLTAYFQLGSATFSTAPFFQRAFYIDQPIYSGTTAGKVITLASTLFIAGAPTTSGSNLTISNSYALQVFSGDVIFAGGLRLGATSGSVATGQLVQSGATQIWNSKTIQFDSSMELDTTGATNGNSLVYNGTKWIAGVSSGSSVGTSGSGSANQIAYWTGPSTLSGNALMDFDSTIPRVRFGLTGNSVNVGINTTSGSNATLQVTQPSWVGGSNPSVLVLTPGTLTSQIGSPATLASQAMTVTWIKANLPSTFSPNVFSAPVLNSNASGGTMATAAAVQIVGAPTSGSNLTVTTAVSLWVQSGLSLFTDGMLIGSLTSGSAGQLWQSSDRQRWSGNIIQFDTAFEFDATAATTNQALVYTGSKWAPGTPAGMLTNNNASSTPRIALWNNTTSLTGDSGFLWDGITFTITPGAQTINTPLTTLLIRPPTYTVVHNLNESIDVDIDLSHFHAGTTFTSGSIAAMRAMVIRPPIWGLDIGSPGTINDGATLAITGAPTTSGSSLTVTRMHALWVQAGEVLFAGGLDLGTALGATTGQLRQSAATQIWNSNTIQFDSSMELDPSGATNGQALVYNGSKWIASSAGGVSGISGAGTANQVAYFTSGSVITSGSNFTFNGNQVGLLTSGSSGGILFGLDTLLYRKSARILGLAGGLTIDDGLNLGTATGASVGQLKQSATSMVLGSSTFTLDASAEVDPTGATTNQVLTYNGSKWIAQTATSGSSGGSLDFYNVVDYGADKTGTLDSTSAITSAISAATSGGVLFFPKGSYKTSGNITISQTMYILGEGMADNYGINALTQINCTSGSNSVFVITARNGAASNIALKNTSGSSPSPTAGAAITVAGSDEGQKFNFDSVSSYGFYYGFDVQVGQQWTMRNCQSMGSVKYGLKIRNTVNGDGGDWSVSDSYFNSDTYDSDAGIKIESSGGGKITNCKFNDGFTSPGHKFTYPIYLEPTSPTSILLISNNSIENVGTHGIFANIGGSAYNQLIIRGNQISTGAGSGNSINITSGSINKIRHVVIADNIFLSTSGSSAVSLTKVDDIFLDNNVYIGFTNVFTQSGCTNIFNEAFDGDYSEANYNTAAITLGTSATGAYADTDATNAKITFTPSSDGRYRVTFIFSHDRKSAACDVFFRLTDGTVQSLSQESFSALATAEEVSVVTLSKVFAWTSQSSHTVKLQHRNGPQTTTTVNQISGDSTLNIGLYMTVERIGS